MKKFCKNIAILIYIFVLVILTCNCSYAKGKFIELDFIPQDSNQAVKLNNDEIFFPGGSLDKNGNINSAKIYNIQENKLIDTKAIMNIPRNNYVVIKYNNEEILIIGGRTKNNKNANNIVEIYNIKNNKYTRVEDLDIKNFIQPDGILLKDNQIFSLSNCEAQIFNPTNRTYSFVGIPHNVTTILKTSGSDWTKNAICYTNDYHVSVGSNLVLLNDGRILIYDDYYSPVKNNRVEFFIPEANKFETLDLPSDIRLYKTSVILKNGQILFIGGYEKTGQVTKLDPKTNTFKKITDLKIGANGCIAKVLNDNEILLLSGTISTDDIFSLGNRFLVSAIYDIKQKKITNLKEDIGFKEHYTPQVFDIGNNKIIILEYKHKTRIYKY